MITLENMIYKNIFDAHAHYDDDSFNSDREKVFEELPLKGVCGIVNNAVDMETTEISIKYAEKYPYIWATAGFHPQKVNKLTPDYEDKIANFLSHPKVVAVGEIGLEYHYDIPKDLQMSLVRKQLALAKDFNMPMVFHDREAHMDTLNLLKEFRPKGLVHCFSGSTEMLKEILKLGLSISLGGAVTFKNAKYPVEVAKEVPLDRLLLETDAPYMTPVPFRGKRCDSSYIIYTAEKIAEVKNMSVQELLDITKENALKLYGI